MKIIEILANGKLNISCELFPPKQGSELENMRQIVAEIAGLAPSYMSVTYGAGGNTVGTSVEVAETIESLGIPSLAHLTCVGADDQSITRVLQKLQVAKVQNILALRGDLPDGDALGTFRHASDLACFIKKQGNFCLGGAAYPEGHPESGSLNEDIENLKYKLDAGVDFLVTQMFFDNTILYNYSMRLMQAGINVPLVPGIMPVTNALQIKRICALSGTKLPVNFSRMVEKFQQKPAALKQAGIAYATDQIIDLFVNGFHNVHIYTMNKPDIVGGIMKNLSEILG
ncbi:MAG: methylenetetrahydrofolate reductase [Phascolarctobacterium sp.]|nr:methylenetetrahydrofolate reductase [Phascolarctobacterium sp.]